MYLLNPAISVPLQRLRLIGTLSLILLLPATRLAQQSRSCCELAEQSGEANKQEHQRRKAEARADAALEKAFPNSSSAAQANKRIAELDASPAAIKDGLLFVIGGTFTIGCTAEQKDCGRDESPTTRVTVSDFYLGKHEVTFDEYDAFCTATGRVKTSDQGWGRGQRPVINVSWNDAVAYCNWRSENEGLTKVYTISGSSVTANWNANGYRLPTEAEWEYAARGGGKAVLFGNGKNIADPREINFNSSSAYKKAYSITGEYRPITVPVGSLNSPNALGLHDMSGNVWEWCWDWKASYPGGERNNYRGPDRGSRRVCRGGSWFSYPQGVRVAVRVNSAPDDHYSVIGFRLARSVK